MKSFHKRLISYFVCMYVGTCIPEHTCVYQVAVVELILYFYHVNLQNWTKDSCLVASPFTSWAISLAQMSYTDGETEALKRSNLQCVTNYEVWLDEEQEFWASRSNM